MLMLCCNVFIFVVKQGVPSGEDLERLSQKLEKWKTVGRRLEIEEERLTAFDYENKEWSEKRYKMLLHWKARNGSAATYTVLHDALCHSLVNRKDLAEQFTTGNISLILQFIKNTIAYKYSANSQTPCFLATVSFMYVFDSASKLEKCRFICR